jgi:hypothetical protein
MNSSESVSVSALASAPLFPGDTGELPVETRRVLVQLLAGPSIDARRHGKLWPALIRDEGLVRARLSELFLDLIIDRDLQVAFTRQADTAELDAPALLRRAQLTFLDSALLLFLRQRLTAADARVERAVVAGSDLNSHLTLYERALNTDKAGFNRRATAALKKMMQQKILIKLRGSDDRYEISPALKLLFSPEDIARLSALYTRIAAGEQMSIGVVDPDEDSEDAV